MKLSLGHERYANKYANNAAETERRWEMSRRVFSIGMKNKSWCSELQGYCAGARMNKEEQEESRRKEKR